MIFVFFLISGTIKVVVALVSFRIVDACCRAGVVFDGVTPELVFAIWGGLLQPESFPRVFLEHQRHSALDRENADWQGTRDRRSRFGASAGFSAWQVHREEATLFLTNPNANGPWYSPCSRFARRGHWSGNR